MSYLHLAETRQRPDGKYEWLCRCGASDTGFVSRHEARKSGDVHLAKANNEGGQ